MDAGGAPQAKELKLCRPEIPLVRSCIGDDCTDISGCRDCGDQGLSGDDGECILAMAAKKATNQ